MTPRGAHDQQREGLQLVDVRGTDELVVAKFPDAIHIPMAEIPVRLDELDRTRPIAVVCRSGERSADVTRYLNHVGFKARNVRGGLRQWIRSGLPLQT